MQKLWRKRLNLKRQVDREGLFCNSMRKSAFFRKLGIWWFRELRLEG
jgi:hypothetical protein